MSRGNKGFTLVEALVAITLVGVGIASAMSGLAHMSAAQVRARDTEKMQRLALQKYDELLAIGNINSANLSGDFSDRSFDDIEWQATVEPSGVTDLSSLTVTVDKRGDDEGPKATIDGLVYIAPATTAPAGATP